MEQRERLIEIIQSSVGGCARNWAEVIADGLLANGVVVPPYKVGQKVWIVYTPKYPANPKDKGKWFMREDGVQRIIYGAKGISIETWNVGTIPAKEISTKLFLTREEAEAELERRMK